MDTDSDGIQDANEMGIASVRVELWKAGAFDSFTTTDANGQYIFPNVLPNTAYEIKILAANIPSGKSLTLKDATSTGAADVADSDASLVGTDAVIAYTTGSAGQNNHTLDFGFKVACNLNASLSSTNVTCRNAANGTATLTVTGAVATPTYLWSNGATTKDLSNVIADIYSVTVTDGACSTTASVTITQPATAVNAGTDQTLVCNGGIAPSIASLGAAPSGHTWFIITQPSSASATVNNTGAAANMTIDGNYIFELRSDIDATCKDDVQIAIPSCAILCPSPNCGDGISLRKL
jgi:hypothetical protein